MDSCWAGCYPEPVIFVLAAIWGLPYLGAVLEKRSLFHNQRIDRDSDRDRKTIDQLGIEALHAHCDDTGLKRSDDQDAYEGAIHRTTPAKDRRASDKHRRQRGQQEAVAARVASVSPKADANNLFIVILPNTSCGTFGADPTARRRAIFDRACKKGIGGLKDI